MPRVSPMYRFIKQYYLETRTLCIGLSWDEARHNALGIWSAMSNEDKQLFKDRVLALELRELSQYALVYYPEIESTTDDFLQEMADTEIGDIAEQIMTSPTTPVYFLRICESASYLSYPDEMTIIQFSLARGVENIFHALFDTQGLEEHEVWEAVNRMKTKLHLLPIRHHERASKNVRDLSEEIRKITKSCQLFTPRSKMVPSHAMIQLVNRVDVRYEHDSFELFRIEKLLEALVKHQISEDEIIRRLSHAEKSSRANLACDFHQACERTEKCSLLDALLMAETFAAIFQKHQKVPRPAFYVGIRPAGKNFTGGDKSKDKSSAKAIAFRNSRRR